VLMCLGELEHHRPLACLTQHVNPHKVMNDPPSRRMLNPVPLLVRKRRFLVCERFPDTVFQGCIDQQAHRHHHQ